MSRQGEISTEVLLQFYEKMLLIRRFEEKVYELAKRGVVRGSVHLCLGQEAPPVAACMSIDEQDYILPTHRGHGQALARGTDPKLLLAEILGKETGLCRGRVGSMHIFDRDTNNLGANGIVGAEFPIAVGVGLAVKSKAPQACAVCFFGDGSTNQGGFYEALNLASLWELPVVFVCLNNQYGMGTNYSRTSAVRVHEKAKLFGLEAEEVDGNDVVEIYRRLQTLVPNVRKTNMPVLLECLTYRMIGHSAFDERPYRPKKEIEEWKKCDPIERLSSRLKDTGIGEDELNAREKQVETKLEAAESFALESEYPVFEAGLEQ